MLLGHARGKVGSLVFSRSNGQQVTRAKAETIKNPQTQKQVVQRIILNTIAQAYSRMSAITDHSFEGKTTAQDNMSAFMKRNMNDMRSRISSEVESGSSFEEIYDFVPIGQSWMAYNRLVISAGALPKVGVQSVTAGTGALTAPVAANTYQGVIDAFNLQRGDQLTFVCWVEDARANRYFHFARVILDPTDADGTKLPMSTEFITNGAINKPSPKNEGNFAILSWSANGILFSVGNSTCAAAAVIVSREKADGTWARSEATLELDETYIEEQGDGINLQYAIDKFYENGIGLDNDKFLNNAAKGTKAAATESNP